MLPSPTASMEIPLTNATVRSWNVSDVAPLVRHANNRAVWRNLRDRFPHPYTRDYAIRWIRAATRSTPESHFAIAIDGEAVGGIGLEIQSDVFRRSAEIGYWLGEVHWGRGIATEALRAMTEFGFTTFDLCRIHAIVFEWNAASMRVLEKAGYSCEARLRQAVTKEGQTMDQFIYAVVRT